MAETGKAVWMIDLTGTSQDRRAPRTAIEAPYSSELTGVDPLFEGGLRPHPGFRQIHFFKLDDLEYTDSSGTQHHDFGSGVSDCFCFDFNIGLGYGFGFVYRVERAGPVADVYADYWNSLSGEWNRGLLLKQDVAVSRATHPTLGRQMSVAVAGRFVYTFIEGDRPILLYVGGETPWEPVVETETGPGKQPTLVGPDVAGALGSITMMDVAERPGAGQVVLTNTLPSATSLGLGVGTTSSGDLIGQKDSDVRALEPGDYVFAFQLLDSVTGRKSPLSEIAQTRKEEFMASTSSSAPQVSLYAAMEILYDSTKYDQALVYRSVRVQDAGGTFAAGILFLDRIIKLDEFNTNTTLSTSSSGDPITYKQSVYYYELEDKALIYQPTFDDEATFDEEMPRGGSGHWFGSTMLVSKIRSGNPSTTIKPRLGDPQRGIGETRYSSTYDWSPELFPPSNRLNPSLPSNDILVFRQVGQTVIGFSKDRQYLFRMDAGYLRMVEIHEGFGCINDRAADSVGSMIYFVTTKGVKSVDSQGQLDDVRAINHTVLTEWKASLSKVSCAYDAGMSCFLAYNSEEEELVTFCMNTGMVARLEDCVFKQVLRGVWPDDFTWDSDDLENHEGANNDTYRNQLVARAMFVASPTAASETPYVPVYVVDYTRVRTKGTGPNASSAQHTLLPVAGDSIWALSQAFNSGVTLHLAEDAAKGFSTGSGSVNDAGFINYGHKLYVVWSATSSLLGRSAAIAGATYTPGSPIDVDLDGGDASNLHGLAAGDVVGISPVVVRWGGTPLGVNRDPRSGDPTGRDFHSLKHVDSLSACFTDVTGSATGETKAVARYAGLLYRGNEATPLETAQTLDTGSALAVSITSTQPESKNYAAFGQGDTALRGRNGRVGTVLSPGVVVACPDLDFTLISVKVEGEVRDSYLASRLT